MITPSCDEILSLATDYTTIPVCREVYADVTTKAAKNGRAIPSWATTPFCA